MINLQPNLENEKAILFPLQPSDFEVLYVVASDPKIWEQHPNKNRWKREVFQTFFEGAMQSGGAFKVVDKATGKAAGSTRFYNYNNTEKSILIGYSFYGTSYWGTGLNKSVKAMMLHYIFPFVNTVHFHIGAFNLRSQIAIERIGAKKTGEIEVAYHGEDTQLNFIYSITKEDWLKLNKPL